MRFTADDRSTRRRGRVVLLALLAAVAVLTPVAAVPASAAPTPSPSPTKSGEDDEGGTPTLREVLEAASRGYIDAKAKLDNSKKRQLALSLRLKTTQTQLADLTVEIGALAAVAYRTGRLGRVSVLLSSTSPDAFVERATAVNMMTVRDDAQLRRLRDLQDQLAREKKAIDAEVREQAKQTEIMAKRKKDAERALANSRPVGGYLNPNSPLAKPAPRNPDGSWPRESCTVDDPTTSGCLTPRTLHALLQAKAAGFTRYVSCYRSGGGGEHPKGRACDFAADKYGFGDTATGASRTYGNELASFFIKNASRLGVLYVIWYRQIWMPSTGWRSYSGCCAPNQTHTNHVHLSVY